VITINQPIACNVKLLMAVVVCRHATKHFVAVVNVMELHEKKNSVKSNLVLPTHMHVAKQQFGLQFS